MITKQRLLDINDRAVALAKAGVDDDLADSLVGDVITLADEVFRLHSLIDSYAKYVAATNKMHADERRELDVLRAVVAGNPDEVARVRQLMRLGKPEDRSGEIER